MLKETDGYVSGQEICEKLSVSRTAVWKAVKQLEEDGYEIEAVRNRGYHLKMAGDILSYDELASSINTVWAGKNLLYFDEVDSTNNVIKKEAEAGAPHGTLAVADYQSGGRGRRGRVWKSPHGVGIWMSLLTRPKLSPAAAPMMTLPAALAVANGIREATGLVTQIKWPNDVVVHGKKVCGILTEMSAELEAINYIVTGIGINVNTEAFPEDIAATATSLRLETGHPVKRSPIVGSIMKAYEEAYAGFMEHGDMTSLLDTYNGMLANRNNGVRVLAPEHEYTGTALGIDEKGSLLVRKEDGAIAHVISGEVSVRGIYGYI
jgi:BirA family biotin operon repressor/biotin-[acetyl-CoA-carboxylase] ligase